MKKLSFFGLGLMVLLSSCFKEPKPEPVGEAKVSVVNAVSTSTPQDVYYNGKKMSITPLAYGSVSPYLTITSGASYFGFTDQNTTVANYEGAATIKIGEHFTVIYYTRLDGSKNIGFLIDDMTPPPTGKARVRFVHLNSLYPRTIAVGIEGGADLTLTLPFANSSAYFDVDPDAKFVVKALDIETDAVIDAHMEAGKIYTIWIDGIATEMTGHSIQHN